MQQDVRPLRLLIAAGGTGGHIYPGLAVARRFVERHPDADIVFVGTSRGMEQEIIGAAGFEVRLLRADPLRGGSLLRKAKGIAALLPALRDARRLLADYRPDLVFGVGGYVAGPLLLAASLRRFPTLILEPNFDPGLTNKWLARFVDGAVVAWRETGEHFRGKALVTGNPIRSEIAAVGDVDTEGGLRLLVFGGSQGSRVLNDAMVSALPHLAAEISITHQTGAADLARVRAAYAAAGRTARIAPYLHHMSTAYADCNLVMSRAGATTCAELAAAGRGAVLVPLELAGAHQRYNAEALVGAGAALLIRESALGGARLAATLNPFAADPARLTTLAQCARAQSKPNATDKIVQRLEDLIARP